MGPIIWTPPPAAATTSNLARFMAYLSSQGHPFVDYDELLAWSTSDVTEFWRAATEFTGVRWHEAPSDIVANGDLTMPGVQWFPGGTLNYAEHALAAAASRPDAVAVVACSQTRERTELVWAELLDQVSRCRAGLQRLGVERGDRVVAYLPNIPETLVAFLAVASLGAVWASCPPEFGVRSVVDRFTQIEPKVLFAADGYRYGDKTIDRTQEVAEIRASLPSVQHTVGVAYLGTGPDDWGPLLAESRPIAFEAVPFGHPLYVLYSSGTTGLPKPIVHGHGGITVEHLKVLTLHNDLGPSDRFGWYTTTGWMMWNYVISGLLTGSSIVLFDGNPGAPDLLTLWRLAAEERCTVFGVSAPFIGSCRKAGLRPKDELDLSALRQVCSTGAPLPAEGFEWLVDAVSATAQPVSISGGTDVCSAFLGMVATLPVRAGEITRPLLGCLVHAVDAEGNEVPVGQQGELVIDAPMPSMPVGFWNDQAGERYRNAYFADFPGRWRHGDWITFTEEGGCTISGRSDATLNRGGVRLGTSDFYSVVEAFPEIADSLVIHLDGGPDDDTGMGELVLFVAPAPGVELTDELRGRINRALRTQLSPRHVPDSIEAVPGIPRTLSGKKLEVPVKKMLRGMPADEAASRGSLANPEVLSAFERLAR